jgi:hypothetical protein
LPAPEDLNVNVSTGPLARGIAAAAMLTIGTLAAKSARADCFDVGGNEVCNNMNMPAPKPQPRPPQPSIPPCYLEQNAMRPCDSGKAQSQHVQKVTGVDPNIAGTWTYQQPHGLWVLEVSQNGTTNSIAKPVMALHPMWVRLAPGMITGH